MSDRHRGYHRRGSDGGRRSRSRSQSRSSSRSARHPNRLSRGRAEHSKRGGRSPLPTSSSSHKRRPRSPDDEKALYPPFSSKSTSHRARDQKELKPTTSSISPPSISSLSPKASIVGVAELEKLLHEATVGRSSVVAANIMKAEPSLTWADIMEASDSVLERYGVSDLKIGRIRSLIKTKYSGEVSPEEERPAKRAKMGSSSTTTSSTAGTVPELTPFNQLIQLPVMQLKLFDHSFFRLIGKADIQNIAEEIADDLPRPSGDRQRKSPFALVSMSRGGKTRALLELTKALRERKRIPTICISFNDVTAFSTKEEDLEMALIRRMTFALRSENYREMPFEECAANNVDFVRLLVNYKGPLVLCIDELNKVMKLPNKELPNKATSQQKDLWTFLTTHFLKEKRMLIFSAHERSTVLRLVSDTWMTESNREIKVRRLPRMERKEDMQFLHEYGFPLTKAALCGFIPAQLINWSSILDRAETMKIDNTSYTVGHFAGTCLSGNIDDKLGSPPEDVDLRADVYDFREAHTTKIRKRSIWSPFWIVNLLRAYLPETFQHLSNQLDHSLSSHSQVWELLVAIAVVLHRLAATVMVDNCLVRIKRCDSSQIGFLVVPEKTSKGAPISDIFQMEEWLNSPEFCFINYSNTVHLVIMPAHPRFEMYDVLEAHKDNGQWKLIAGYQAKTAYNTVDPAALPDSSSWLVYLDTPTTTKPREDGWIKLNQTQLSKFLGVSLWDCAEKLIADGQGIYAPEKYLPGYYTASLDGKFSKAIPSMWPEGKRNANYKFPFGRHKLDVSSDTGVITLMPNEGNGEYRICIHLCEGDDVLGANDASGWIIATANTQDLQQSLRLESLAETLGWKIEHRTNAVTVICPPPPIMPDPTTTATTTTATPCQQ